MVVRGEEGKKETKKKEANVKHYVIVPPQSAVEGGKGEPEGGERIGHPSEIVLHMQKAAAKLATIPRAQIRATYSNKTRPRPPLVFK